MKLFNSKLLFLVLLLSSLFNTCKQNKKTPFDNLNIAKFIYGHIEYLHPDDDYKWGIGLPDFQIKPFLLPINVDEKRIDNSIYWSLPDSLRPQKNDPINTIAAIFYNRVYKGDYLDGTSAYSLACTIYLIDKETSKVFAWDHFEPQPAKFKSSALKTDTITRPTKEIVKYLKSFYLGDIGEIEDQKQLANIANDHQYMDDTRAAAIGRLKSSQWQDMLAQIAKSEKSALLRLKAVEGLDPIRWKNLLYKITRNDESLPVKIASYWKLGDQNFIEKIVIDFKGATENSDILESCVFRNNVEEILESRYYAISKMENQDTLLKIAQNEGEEEELRLLAIEKIENQEALVNIAIKEFGIIAVRAVDKIKDQKLLSNIIKSDSLPYFLLTRALMKIKEKGLLKEISDDIRSNNATSTYVRNLVNLRLEDPKKVIEIAINDKDYNKRKMAIFCITDTDNIFSALAKLRNDKMLMDIAENESNARTRIEAVMRIKDQNLLVEMVKHSSDNISSISKRRNRDNSLSEDDSYVLIKAIDMLEDDSLITEITTNIKLDKNIRIAAICRLTSPNVLERIARNHKEDFDIRKVSEERLEKLKSINESKK